MSIPIPMGIQLTAARALLGWSAADLADRAGVSLATVKRAEASAGEADGSLIKLAAICGALLSAGIVFPREMSRITVALETRRRA